LVLELAGVVIKTLMRRLPPGLSAKLHGMVAAWLQHSVPGLRRAAAQTAGLWVDALALEYTGSQGLFRDIFPLLKSAVVDAIDAQADSDSEEYAASEGEASALAKAASWGPLYMILRVLEKVLLADSGLSEQLTHLPARSAEIPSKKRTKSAALDSTLSLSTAALWEAITVSAPSSLFDLLVD
jgi:hypothetical protein